MKSVHEIMMLSIGETMNQNENLKKWINCCKSSEKNSDRMKELGQVELWNKRADGFARKLNPANRRERMNEIFEMLNEAGFRAEGAKVLDIGCGPGAISIPLAKAGANVTAVDISPRILEHIKSNANNEGLSLETVECSWWNADIDELGFRNKFDLVVTSMTPAIKDFETFDRMVACSKKYCYYSHFIQRGGNRIPEEIYHNILKTSYTRQSEGTNSPFMNNFMYLYLKGYMPLVKFNSNHKKEELNWDEAAGRAIDAIGRSFNCTDAMKNEIYNYYQSSAKDGKYSSKSGVYTGMMVWKIDS